MNKETANSFIKTKEYQEFKAYMLSQFQDKPLSIKTEGKTNEMIALEYKATELAYRKLLLGIRRFERLAGVDTVKPQSYR